jgi:hypothetical protein
MTVMGQLRDAGPAVGRPKVIASTATIRRADRQILDCCSACWVLWPLDRALLFGARDGGNEAEGIFSQFVADAVGA